MIKLIPKKKWGQNFLIDPNTCKKIVSSINTDNISHILEIGPGTGAITDLLVKKIKKVTAVEIDSNLCDILRDKKISNLNIINEDILKFDLTNFKNEIIIGNLPYYITTPIIFKIFQSGINWKEIYFLMQKEVADRIIAKPKSKSYGRLTIMTQIFSNVERLFNVSSKVFRPIPKIESSFMKFTRNNTNKIKDHNRFEKIIRTIFNQRRKKFKNCISKEMNLKSINEFKNVR